MNINFVNDGDWVKIASNRSYEVFSGRVESEGGYQYVGHHDLSISELLGRGFHIAEHKKESDYPQPKRYNPEVEKALREYKDELLNVLRTNGYDWSHDRNTSGVQHVINHIEGTK